MLEDKQSQLEQFQEMSQVMLELSEANDWDKLPDLENKRQAIMRSIFSEKVSVQDAPQVEKIIKEVLLINEKITKLAEKSKVSISFKRQNIIKRQNVHSAYIQNK